jgi:DNA-binding IclR family transcriptional regulator
MGNRPSTDVENRARVWGHILETLRRHGRVEAEGVATAFEVAVDEARTVCREMAESGWLERGEERRGWTAGESAAELLRAYPPLRADVAAQRAERPPVRTRTGQSAY